MKIYNYISALLIAGIASFSSCSQEDLNVNETGSSNGFRISVTDGGFIDTTPGTRTIENGYTTTFSEGDVIGVFGVDAGGIVTDINNRKFTMKNGSWEIEGTPIEYKGADFKDMDFYAYYPYDVTITNTLTNVNAEADLKIPVTVLSSGEINAQRNNAKKYWNAGAWASTARTDLVNLSLPTEKDYLYFGADGGRYVNNGRADGFSPVTPEDEPNNLDTDNPGYKINLDMKHAMAMVSFRVYDGGRLSGNNVNFTKFTIKNHIGGTNLFKNGSGKMSLTDGAITETVATAELSRTITNYVLMRQVEAGEGQYAFIQTGTTTGGINGKTVSKSVSAIVYPVNFGKNEIDLEITLKEGDNTPVVYPVTLAGNQWEPNNNYIYTLSAGRNKLTVMDVSVEAWADNEQDEIPL